MRIVLVALFSLLLFGFSSEKEGITIFTIGDSTMANKTKADHRWERGWAMMLPEYFLPGVKIDNQAVNGRSSKSFINGGRWQKVVDQIKPGDYVFIQFGHNDNKPDSTIHTDAETSFKANLTRFVSESREKGATPVLFTSIVRRAFSSDGKLRDTHGRYVEVVRELASQLKVPCIDLNASTRELVEEMGEDASKSLFNWGDGKQDNTHLNGVGARKVARMALEEIKTKIPELSGQIILPNHSVKYGSHPRQVIDLWLAQSAKPTPLVIYIHGGGWQGGEMSTTHWNGLHEFLKEGISVATIDYRYITEAMEAGVNPPVKWPLTDAARALQFIRSNAAIWNLDKNRIGAIGGSAGACSSLWLAMHDEMADPDNSDPVARESTRLRCVGVWDAQTSLDPAQLFEWFEKPVYGAHAFGFLQYIDGKEQQDMDLFRKNRARLLPWIREYSPIEWASPDDPPVCIGYQKNPGPSGEPQSDSVHGAMSGIKLKEKMDSLGVPCKIVFPINIKDPQAEYKQFLIRELKK